MRKPPRVTAIKQNYLTSRNIMYVKKLRIEVNKAHRGTRKNSDRGALVPFLDYFSIGVAQNEGYFLGIIFWGY